LSSMSDHYAEFSFHNLAELENLLMVNLEEIKEMLSEYDKIKYREIMKVKLGKNNCFARIANKCIKDSNRTTSSGLIQHMDKIIEEYLTLDFINHEMLFNKKNYEKMLASNEKIKPKEEIEDDIRTMSVID
jgi:hypothetical protein